MSQMAELAEASTRAAQAATDAAQAVRERSEGFRSPPGSDHAAKRPEEATAAKHVPPLMPMPAVAITSSTTENLRQHREASRARSPARQSGPPARQQQEVLNNNPNMAGNLLQGNWSVSKDVTAGSSRIELADYTGLAIGDTLEKDAGTTNAEIITITGFGSILNAAPTQFQHVAGATVRRLVEGTGARWQPAAFGVGASASSRPPYASTYNGGDDGFEDRASWSPRHREYQLAKFRRKRREMRSAETEKLQQPNLVVCASLSALCSNSGRRSQVFGGGCSTRARRGGSSPAVGTTPNITWKRL